MIQDNWLLALAFPSIFSLAMGLIIRFVNEKKFLKMTKPPVGKAALFLSKFLITQFGEKGGQKFENGFIITICRVIRLTIEHFEKVLISDNVKK